MGMFPFFVSGIMCRGERSEEIVRVSCQGFA